MPSSLDQRLEATDAELMELFNGVEIDQTSRKQVQKVKKYYRKLTERAITRGEKVESLDLYVVLVKGLKGVKNGELNKEEVLKEIGEINDLRKEGIVLENILNTLELLFWATASVLFFAWTLSLAIPAVAVNPLLALAVLSIACTMTIVSICNFFDCIESYQSFSPVNEEFKRENQLFSFFQPDSSNSFQSSTHQNERDEQGLATLEC